MPIPGYRAAVLDQNGEPCAPGVVGRLALKGPTGCRYIADERSGDKESGDREAGIGDI